jgi:hypothetical protein
MGPRHRGDGGGSKDLSGGYGEMLTVKPQNHYNPNTYEQNPVNADGTVLLHSPTRHHGSSSYMVSLRDRVITFDGVYLAPIPSLLFQISESYPQKVGEWDDNNKRSIAGVSSFEQYPPGLEGFPAAGGSTVQVGGTLVPSWTLPLPPWRVLVPQRRYVVGANSRRGFNPEPPIMFAIGNQSGMSLQDAMDERYEGLVGRDDAMFIGCNCTAISLRIEVHTPPVFF